jgi:uncharacterized protein with WD repeat
MAVGLEKRQAPQQLHVCVCACACLRQDFEWSPSEPVLAAYSVEQGNQPARIVLVKIPERTEMRQKNMLNVSGGNGTED